MLLNLRDENVFEPIITSILVRLGFIPTLKGYDYFKYGVRCLLDASRSSSVSMREIWKQIGENFGVSAISVERVMRYSMNKLPVSDEGLLEMYGYKLSATTPRSLLFAIYQVYVMEVDKRNEIFSSDVQTTDVE